MSEPALLDETSLETGAQWLQDNCPVWAREMPALLPLDLRRREAGFDLLAEAIVGQVISVQAAATVQRRLVEAGLWGEAAMAQAAPDLLRGCGLSPSKVKWLQGLAQSDLDWDALRSRSDQEVEAALTALPGIGPWTAQIYLCFGLLRRDAFPAQDLAMAEAARILYQLDERPGPAAFKKLAAPWRPWRGVASRALWMWYLRHKGLEDYW